MRPLIAEVLSALLAQFPRGAELSLDQIGASLGARAVTADEIAWLIDRLEHEGRRIGGPEGPGAMASLARVLPAARALRAAAGKAPTVPELAQATSLPEAEIRRALLLARVLGR